MTEVPNQGDPCACGSVDTWHPECYALKAGREYELQRLRQLMAEAVRDFHGKAVLFSAAFLKAAEPAKTKRRARHEPPNVAIKRGPTA
jgi:hypothetical protein